MASESTLRQRSQDAVLTPDDVRASSTFEDSDHLRHLAVQPPHHDDAVAAFLLNRGFRPTSLILELWRVFRPPNHIQLFLAEYGREGMIYA